MKQLLLLILLVSIGTSYAQESKLYGKWKNTTNHNGEQYEFFEDHTAVLIKDGQESQRFKYSFNAGTKPNQIDLEISDDDFVMTLLGLMDFEDDNTIKLELFPEDSGRPTSFSENEDDSGATIRLVRL